MTFEREKLEEEKNQKSVLFKIFFMAIVLVNKRKIFANFRERIKKF